MDTSIMVWGRRMGARVGRTRARRRSTGCSSRMGARGLEEAAAVVGLVADQVVAEGKDKDKEGRG